MRKTPIVVGTTLLFGALLIVPASAADTATTFSITAGTLAITAPTTASLGAAESGVALTGQLGAVTVADQRAASDPSWTASATASDFTTGTATAPETVASDFVNYGSGPASATVGGGTFTPGQVVADDGAPLSDDVTAFTHAGGTGSNSTTWNPTLVVNAPRANVSGVYSGTVTNSVA